MLSIGTGVVTVFATVIDWSALGKVVLYSFIAAIGVTVAFSLAILGGTRFADMRRDERLLEAGVFAALAVVATAASLAAVVVAIIVMTSK